MVDKDALLFRPGRIGTLELKNRLVMPPMLMGYGSEDGFVTERAKAYYEARAKGGVGLVIVEASMPQPAGKMFPYYLDCSDDRYAPGLAELAEVIKRHGARAAIQIGDGGRETRFELTGRHPMGPSPVAARKREQPREMTTDDIRSAVKNFAQAVLRVKNAGFEGVEVHGAHVYLLSQFLSASTNFRTDEYGGSTENRARIVLEIAQASRALVGRDFPLWLRINASEYDTEGGIDLDEAQVISRLAQDAGYDAISISAGSPHYEATIQSMYVDRGAMVPLAEAVKQAVDVPVIVTGRLTPDLGEDILRSGHADYIAIGRGLLADAELPAKVLQGRPEDITPCVAALHCVNRGVLRDEPITCMVNAALGREREYEIRPVERAKKVAVIGGGPAGLEAARVAALRGHRVVLFERDRELGGQLLLDSRAPRKETFAELIDYLRGQLTKLGAKLRLGEEATAETVASTGADAVIVATGAAPAHAGRGTNGALVACVDDVLRGDVVPGKTVVIVGGTGRCCEVADLLSDQGRTVTLVTPERKVAPEVVGIVRGALLQRLESKGVTSRTRTRLVAITSAGVEVGDGDVTSNAPEELKAETVLFPERTDLDLALLSELRARIGEVYCAGDCVVRGEPQDAIADGSRVGRHV